MTYWKNLYNLKAEDFPNANRQFETSFSIPFWPDMSQEQVEKVISTIIETGKEYYAST
jgi:dTDP-4-amino-4,6-dideoxygalactose transaminase